VHPKVRGLLSREIAYASGLRYLHSLPHTKGCNRALRKNMQEYDSIKKGNKRLEQKRTFNIHLHINVSGPLRPSRR
jgi:hypothetical protein